MMITKTTRRLIGALAVAATALAATAAAAQIRVTYKSASTASSYYQMAVQFAETMQAAEIDVTVEESQGSVQNVSEAAVRTGNYMFTSPPGLVRAAMSGSGRFEGQANEEIRALFPIPSLTMHFVVRADLGVESFADLEGRTILIGSGSFGAREGARYLELFGVQNVTLADVDLGAAVSALRNRQIDGFVTAGSYPAPNVVEAAAGTGISLISMTDAQVEETGRTRLVIPGGTYSGVDQDTVTTSLPVVAYTTTSMDADTAYAIVRAFWENQEALGASGAWWNGVTPEALANVNTSLHPGALRYYDEIGVEVPEAAR